MTTRDEAVVQAGPWDDLSEPDREVDRRIGERLAAAGENELRAEVERLKRDADLCAESAAIFKRQRVALRDENATLRAAVERLKRDADLCAESAAIFKRERDHQRETLRLVGVRVGVACA